MEHPGPLTDLNAPEQVRVALVSPSLFTVLRATPHRGRFPTAAEAENYPGSRSGLGISHDLWVRRFDADPDIVGRTIEIDRERDVVIGVAEPGFHFPHPETQVWVAWRVQELLSLVGAALSRSSTDAAELASSST